MAKKKSLFQEFTKGILVENPVLRLVLGTCPTLAVSWLLAKLGPELIIQLWTESLPIKKGGDAGQGTWKDEADQSRSEYKPVWFRLWKWRNFPFVEACFVPVGRALGSALKKHCCLSLIFQQKTLNRKSQRFSLDWIGNILHNYEEILHF